MDPITGKYALNSKEFKQDLYRQLLINMQNKSENGYSMLSIDIFFANSSYSLFVTETVSPISFSLKVTVVS